MSANPFVRASSAFTDLVAASWRAQLAPLETLSREGRPEPWSHVHTEKGVTADGRFGAAAAKAGGKRADLKPGFEVSFTRTVTPDLIEAFGEVSGDVSRLHYDEDYAVGTRFGGRIAHGLLTASFVSAALSRLPGLVVYLSQDMRFLAPAREGDEVTAVVRVAENPTDKPWVRLETHCTLGDGTRILEGEAKVLVDDEPDSP